MDSDLGHREHQRPRHGRVVFRRHLTTSGTSERKIKSGTVDHGFLFSDAELGKHCMRVKPKLKHTVAWMENPTTTNETNRVAAAAPATCY